MEKLLKKCHSVIMGQFNSIQVIYNSSQKIQTNLQLILTRDHRVFETPQGLCPLRGTWHAIDSRMSIAQCVSSLTSFYTKE
jgi:hypothetical protein